MKRSAITRMILYSIVALVLTAILAIGMAPEFFMGQFGDTGATDTPKEGHVSAKHIQNLEIDWANGNITIQPSENIDSIYFYETAPDGCWYAMSYSTKGNTLSIDYGETFFGFGKGSLPKKDLVILVPEDWRCEELQFDGAALNITIHDVSIQTLELDGASCDLNFKGSVENVEINGASAHVNLNCINRISKIHVDGASCNLELTLPKGCGYHLEMDGLNCQLNTDLPGISSNNTTIYGDGHCKISVNGLSCEVTIEEAE